MRDIQIINQTLPVIDVNFEEVKRDLQEQLEQYKNLVVTDVSLNLCKEKQKDLAGLRIKIDSYRKDIKKTMSEPITAFENKCKQLVELIEKAEQPLKDGIKVFDDKKRDEKRKTAETVIAEIIKKHGLNEKYASQLTVLDKYTNLTAKISEVRDDLEQRAFILIGQQQRDAEMLELIQDAIDTANKTIKRQLTIRDFQFFIDRGVSTKEIIENVRMQAERIFEAENPKPAEPVPQQESHPEPIHEPEATKPEPQLEDPVWHVEMKITAIASQFMQLKSFLLENKIVYSTGAKTRL